MANLFASQTGDIFPVKMNGQVIGQGKIHSGGYIELNIEDEDAQRRLAGGEVSGLSVDYTSKTIEAIMNNRKKKGL